MIFRRWIANLLAFIRLGRFPFLIGGFVLYGLGVAIAFYEGFHVNWPVFLVGQLIVTATQLMVHYGNDYFDLAADSANPTPIFWSGGSRVLPEGQLPAYIALLSAIALGLIALLATLGLVLHWQLGSLTTYLLLLSICLAWFYSAPPLRLHSHGVGEISATFTVSVLTPTIGFYLQAGQLSRTLFLAIIPLALLQFNVLVSVAIPDAEGDRQVNKRTLVVLLGRLAAARLYVLALAFAYGLLPVLVWGGLPVPVAIAVALSAPLAAWLGWSMWHGAWSHPEQWSRLALLTIALLLSTSALEISAFLKLTFK
ncbi:MAG: prenyltransferase [Chloroflexota bacterium]